MHQQRHQTIPNLPEHVQSKAILAYVVRQINSAAPCIPNLALKIFEDIIYKDATSVMA